jgi:hypothetical protein
MIIASIIKALRTLVICTFVFIIADKIYAQESIIDSTILLSDTATIDGTYYSAYLRTNDTVYINDDRGNVVFKLNGYGYELLFTDFDHDGFKDLVVRHLGNIPGILDLVKYDGDQKRFSFVDFKLYPDAQWIEGTKYYYSYHRSGCADNYWESDLFYIQDFEIVRIGNITGKNCDGVEEEKGIFIFRIENNLSIYVETKPLSALNDYPDYKWGFIRDYWTKNLRRFTDD